MTDGTFHPATIMGKDLRTRTSCFAILYWDVLERIKNTSLNFQSKCLCS